VAPATRVSARRPAAAVAARPVPAPLDPDAALLGLRLADDGF